MNVSRFQVSLSFLLFSSANFIGWPSSLLSWPSKDPMLGYVKLYNHVDKSPWMQHFMARFQINYDKFSKKTMDGTYWHSISCSHIFSTFADHIFVMAIPLSDQAAAEASPAGRFSRLKVVHTVDFSITICRRQLRWWVGMNGVTLVLLWFYYGFIMVYYGFTMVYYGFTMALLWLYYGFNYYGFTTGLLWLYYGFTMVLIWFYYGFTMVLLCVYYGFTLVLLWFYYGFTMDLVWFYYGFTMALLWV